MLMKKIATIFLAANIALLLCSDLIVGQNIITIPSANPQGTGSTASPYRKPLGTNRAYERSAMIYKHSEIGQLGIISSVAFYIDSLNLPGDAITRIFLKEVPDSVMALTTVANLETGAALVYDDTLFSTEFVLDNWITIPLTTSFTHATTSNLMIIVETNSGGTAGTDVNTISKGFRYFATSGNAFQYWQSPTGNGTIPAGNGTASLNRPNIQLGVTDLPVCTTPPNAGFAVASDDSVCVNNVINITLNGADIGTGISYQWIVSNDGMNWSDVIGETNQGYNPTIISDTIVACIVSCSGVSDTTQALNITLNSFLDCYCKSNLGGNCATTALDSIAIVSTSLANGPSGCAPSFYTAYPSTGTTTADLTQGQTYSVVTKFNGAAKASMWIDYNHNGVFDNSEWTLVTNASVAGTEVISNLQIPINASLGQTGMRIRTRATNGALDSAQACATFGSGETEDYIINILQAPNCIAPPDAGITVTSQDSVCYGNSIALTLNSNASGAGISYQWLSSADGLNWAAVPGQNLSFYNPTIVSDSVFACVVTCSSQYDTSVFINITLKSFIDCYCTASLGGNCATTALDSIAIISTTLANGLTGCAPSFYTSFPPLGSTTADLTQGQTYTVITRYNGASKSSCWIDYDHSGTFDNNEWTLITNTATAGVDVSSLLSIPLSATTGFTKMRVRTRATNGALDSTLACATFGSGETEDYVINILPAPNCIAPPDAGIAQASLDTICAGNTVVYTLSGIVIGLGQTYQWIASNDGVNWTDLAGENAITLTAIVNSDSLFACVVTCSGLSDTSSVATVFIKPFYNCYCNLNLGGNCAASAIDSLSITSTSLQNGPTGCAPTFYTAYPNVANTTADLTLGQTYELVARFNANVRTSMWIDYNQNGIFDTYEWVQVCDTSVADSNVFVNFTVPSNALTGLTGMRVRSRVTAGANDSTSACATFGTGEIEDYLVTIQQIVGLNNLALSKNFNVFPNPNNGHFTVSTELKIKQIKLYDICGKEINFNTQQRNANQVEISIENKGIYILRITNENAEIRSHKIIVN